MRALRRLALRDGGQSLVEIGLAMPILALALIGAVDLLRVAAVQQAVINAARVGAEVAAADPTQTGVAEATSELSRTPGLVAANAVITRVRPPCSPSPCTPDEGTLADGTTGCSGAIGVQPCFITVRVQYTFNTIIAWPYVPNQVFLDRTTAMPMVQ